MVIKTMKKLTVVKKIINDGVSDVYDIEVANEHHYILENGIISHNSGFVFASSIVVAMRKLKLKLDEEGEKTTDVKGIRAFCKCMKTRYNKPFEEVELRIPWDSGLDPYSGLIDMFIKKGLLVQNGKMLGYTALDGTYEKYFAKRIPNSLLDKIMAEFTAQMEKRDALSQSAPGLDYDPETGEIFDPPSRDSKEVLDVTD